MGRRLLTAGLIAAGLLLAGPVALAQGRDFGRTTIRVPDATTEGDWPGTWVFENRLRKIAMWIREGDDGLRIRIKQLMMTNAETFDTEWDGEASYNFPNVEGDMGFGTTLHRFTHLLQHGDRLRATLQVVLFFLAAAQDPGFERLAFKVWLRVGDVQAVFVLGNEPNLVEASFFLESNNRGLEFFRPHPGLRQMQGDLTLAGIAQRRQA